MSEAKAKNDANIASNGGEATITGDLEAEDHQQQPSSAGGEGNVPNTISDDVKTGDIGVKEDISSAEDTGDGDSTDNMHEKTALPKKPEGSKLTVPEGGQGESSLYYNPKRKSYSRVGASVLKNKKKSWADAAREDDTTRGESYENYLEHMAGVNGDEALLEMIRKNPELAQQVLQMNMDGDTATVGGMPTGGSGATEEEKAARRERIRARREERLRSGEDEKFEDAGATPKYYRTTDGAIKKIPGFAKEEFLESIKEGGVPIKSWLIIALAMGIGMYQLRKTIRQAEAKGKRKGGATRAASPTKTRATNKAKMRKKNRKSVVIDATEPELDFELDPERPKRVPKHAKKIKSLKKKRVRKTISAPPADAYHDDDDDDNSGTENSVSPDAADNDMPLARPSTGTEIIPANASSGDNGTDELELTSYNEDDRRAIMQVLSEEGGSNGANAAALSDDGEWLTAGRKSKAAKKQKSSDNSTSAEEAKAGTNASEEATVVTPGVMTTEDKQPTPTNSSSGGSSETEQSGRSNDGEEKMKITTQAKAAAPKSKMTLPKSKSAPPSASSEVKPKGPAARASPKLIDTKEEEEKEDAALARKLQKQEENMAAREMGMDVEEEWEEVSPKKKGRKANLVPPSTAIAAT